MRKADDFCCDWHIKGLSIYWMFNNMDQRSLQAHMPITKTNRPLCKTETHYDFLANMFVTNDFTNIFVYNNDQKSLFASMKSNHQFL